MTEPARPITMLIEALHLAAHVHAHVYTGRNPGARGKSGTLVFRTEEWPAFRACFDAEPWVEVREYTGRRANEMAFGPSG